MILRLQAKNLRKEGVTHGGRRACSDIRKKRAARLSMALPGPPASRSRPGSASPSPRHSGGAGRVQSLGDLIRPFATPSGAPCATNWPSADFCLAHARLMAYDKGVMSLTETISCASDCPGWKCLSRPEGRVSRRALKRHCATRGVPDPRTMRQTMRSVRVRRVGTAWGVGHPDEP